MRCDESGVQTPPSRLHVRRIPRTNLWQRWRATCSQMSPLCSATWKVATMSRVRVFPNFKITFRVSPTQEIIEVAFISSSCFADSEPAAAEFSDPEMRQLAEEERALQERREALKRKREDEARQRDVESKRAKSDGSTSSEVVSARRVCFHARACRLMVLFLYRSRLRWLRRWAS